MGTALYLRHCIVAIGLAAWACTLQAQRLDSVHVFNKLPPGDYTSASANALAWKLDRERAPYRAITGDAMATVAEAMKSYQPDKHTYRDLPTLTHVAMGWSGGRPIAFGVADDMDLVINFTARTEYRVSSMTARGRSSAPMTSGKGAPADSVAPEIPSMLMPVNARSPDSTARRCARGSAAMHVRAGSTHGKARA